MRAVVAESSDRLVWQEVPDVSAGPGEVLIKVAASGVNRADVLQAAGKYPPPPGVSDIIGLEVSGIVAAVGPGVTEWSAGQEVCALLAGGGYAEYVAVPADQVLPIPPSVNLVDSAALPEVACTVWSNLVMTAHLRPGQLVLIHGGASGIGSHAIQVARALAARVAITAGSPEKLELCRDLGAQITINYRDEDFVARLKQETDGSGADIILDIMGASYLDRNIDALATDGQLIVIGMQGGVKAELNLGKLLTKRARWSWRSTTRTRSSRTWRARPRYGTTAGPGTCPGRWVSRARSSAIGAAAGSLLPIRGYGAVGSATRSHRVGQGFESP